VVESVAGTASAAGSQRKPKTSTANSQVKPSGFSPEENKNTAVVLDSVFTKPQDKNSATSPAISGNGQTGPFSSPKESPQAIIEGKLSSPVETQNSDLPGDIQTDNAEEQKTDYFKEEKPARESATPPVDTIMRGSLKNRVPVWIYWAGSVALLFFAVTALYSFYYPGKVKRTLYDRAEEHFLHGRHEAALQLYGEYKLRYPADGVIPEVNKRIIQIGENEAAQLQKQVKIYALMQKAAESYNKQCYLKPENDNAMIYIREILQEDPGFVPALALQNRIVDFYFEQAEMAFDIDRYDRAVMYYENILAIRPDDTRIQSDLDRALKLKYVYSMLDDMSTLADAREELKDFLEEKSRLKSKIRQEREKLREASQNLESKQNTTPTKSQTIDKKSVLKTQPVRAGLTFRSN
jgi:tetratricopeptide (TPR) repeat protein